MIGLNELTLLVNLAVFIVTMVGMGAVFAYWLDRYVDNFVKREFDRIYAKRASENNLTGSGKENGSEG